MGVLGEMNTTPSGPKAKGKSKTPLKSPHAAPLGVLSPNNDALEKRRNKLARQASETQKRSFTEALDEARADAAGKSPLQRQSSVLSRSGSIASSNASAPPRRPAALSAESVLNLYSNCIKLASENKINAKNTWSLALIDHISEIVRDSKDEDGQTNFQKSSCTLDAGVKIYASRVDSFHNETFKMLGGMNKVATVEEEEETGAEGAKGDGEGLDGDATSQTTKKRRSTRAVATLEPPDAHTTKQVDETNVVDPLFQKTSALFDEGGASGLLLNNLSVHRGCNICFDSEEVPEYREPTDSAEAPLEGATVDLSSMEHILNAAHRQAAAPGTRITPSVRVVEDLLQGLVGGVAPTAAAAAAREALAADQSAGVAGVSLFDFASGDGVQFAEYDDDEDGENDDAFGFGQNGGFDDFAGGFDDDDTAEAPDERIGASGVLRLEEKEENAGLEWVVNASLGGKMAWAGPSHWRFKALPKRLGVGGDKDGDEDGAEDANKPAKPRREKGALTYDLENPGEPDEARFTLAATAEELLLVAAPTAVDTLLPPDLGYDPSDLARLSLRPSASVTGAGLAGGRRGAAGESFGGDDDDDDGGFGGADDDDDFGFGGFDVVDPDSGPGSANADGLVAAPRRVEKITVNYARSTKQVDVKELKCALWENINSSETSTPHPETGAHSFHALLETFPEDNLAGATEDISVHMAFICMLHLANEHGLTITDRPSLSDLDISNLPVATA
jgi:condensin complex subunit 2